MTDDPPEMPALPRDLPQDAPERLWVTSIPPDGREARLRALFALFFHEAGLESTDETVANLARSAHRLGYALVPIRR